MIFPNEFDFGPPQFHPTAEAIRSGTPPTITAWLPENPALVPEAIATGVLEEASAKRGKQLPREWAAELVQRADLHAQTNPRFRKLLRRPGDESRDWLWSFMRHWLEARPHRQLTSLNTGITPRHTAARRSSARHSGNCPPTG
jgi:hypothetical protein